MKIGLKGHDYRYEVFQIASLFYPKDEIKFMDDGYELEIIYDRDNNKVTASLNGILESLNLNSNDEKEVKNGVKYTLLKLLQNETGVKMPWGILVGIRPTKIVHDAFKRGLNEESIREILKEKYLVSKEKIDLLLEVAKNEAPFLDQPKNSVALYIGIPFCPTRCAYCSFTSNPYKGNNLVEDYLIVLKKEIYSVINFLKDRGITIDTLYVGGGTPTSLNEKELDELFSWVKDLIDVKKLREFTVEAGRPDSLNREKLMILKENGITRISINPQTMNQETLDLIGRRHTVEDVIEKFYLSREVGFNNINMDIIIGLPGEKEEHIKRTMEKILLLMPDSITIHTMAVKRASLLNERMFKGDKDLASRMYDIATDYVKSIGMHPYYMYRQKNMVSPLENVGYSFRGKECIYNIQMIAESTTVIALGADAVTKIVYGESGRIERVANLKDVKEYILRIDEQIDEKIKMLIDIC
ncbi:coproporphyrinogen dehydrogenase HemZ [Caloramator sp. CAR-1]|uniref:coproporphyrinogen dehydrogenase HemZ n=1 Tax=Caloramator sp. CAR-1 TaxID=3062777 RepID=UPI0026E18304|nr:coproporphyrinogen dehydrogenase HemZ [Caloramator sp. CAR-1]MDO6354301.1 coproporphyrinogen dehydrogenase HemZ [Caloramator sp. CAR-1]